MQIQGQDKTFIQNLDNTLTEFRKTPENFRSLKNLEETHSNDDDMLMNFLYTQSNAVSSENNEPMPGAMEEE
jgi:hypothetical protein